MNGMIKIKKTPGIMMIVPHHVGVNVNPFLNLAFMLHISIWFQNRGIVIIDHFK